MNNKRIKQFDIVGQLADDSFILGHREKMEKLIDMQMRDTGYVPHLDLDTQYFLSYNEDKDSYEFKIVSFGVYVGKKKSNQIVGISGTTYIYKQENMLLETYSKSQMKEILKGIGMTIEATYGNDYMCFCPFHGNRDTPSFCVSAFKGVYVCYNPACGASGNIKDLVKKVSHRNEFEAMRYLIMTSSNAPGKFEDELSELLADEPEFVEFSQNKLDELYNSVNERAEQYFASRGINRDAIDYFKLGYSANQDMVIVPIHSPDGIPVGLVGRSIEDKKFKNSRNLPRQKTMFNLHRAKRQGGTIIVVESSFDAIKLYQAGFPNAVATLGGSLSNHNLNNLNRFASKIIIATDNDEAGRKLGKQIADKLKGKEVLWASYEYGIVYPHDAKDIGDMTEQEIRQCILNAVPNYEYANWN